MAIAKADWDLQLRDTSRQSEKQIGLARTIVTDLIRSGHLTHVDAMTHERKSSAEGEQRI